MYEFRAYSQACGTKAPWHAHKSLLYVCSIYSMRSMLHETPSWQQSPSMKTCMPDWNSMPVVQNSKACLVAHALMFIVATARHWRRRHTGVNRRGGIHRALGMGTHAHVSRMYYACTMPVLRLPVLCMCDACMLYACMCYACLSYTYVLHACVMHVLHAFVLPPVLLHAVDFIMTTGRMPCSALTCIVIQ